MCVETTTTYENCKAVRIHTTICAKHIEYTRQQIDNRPCPDFRKTSQHSAATARCDCKFQPRGFKCARAKSKGYGEKGLTWEFERAPVMVLKKNKDRAKEKAGDGMQDGEAENVWDENHDGRGRRGAIDLGRPDDIMNEDDVQNKLLTDAIKALEEKTNVETKRRKLKKIGEAINLEQTEQEHGYAFESSHQRQENGTGMKDENREIEMED